MINMNVLLLVFLVSFASSLQQIEEKAIDFQEIAIKLCLKFLRPVIKQQVGPLLNPYLHEIDPIYDIFNRDYGLYDLVALFTNKDEPSINITEINNSIQQIFPLLLEASSYDFFSQVAGTSEKTFENIVLYSSFVDPSLNIVKLLEQYLPEEIPIKLVVGVLPSLLKNNYHLFKVLNIEYDIGYQFVCKVAPIFDSLTIGDLLDLLGIKLEHTVKFFMALKKNFKKETSVPFLQFLVNDFGLRPVVIIEELINMMNSIVINEEKIQFDEIFNKLIIFAPSIFSPIYNLLHDNIPYYLKELLPVISIVCDFHSNTIENRFESLSLSIQQLLNHPTIKLLPAEIKEYLAIGKRLVDNFDIKKDIDLSEQLNAIGNISLVDISYVISNITHHKNASIVEVIINFIPRESNINYFVELVSALSREDSTLHELAISICGLIGGKEQINSFEYLLSSIIDPTISILNENSNSTLISVSEMLYQILGEDNFVVDAKLMEILENILKQLASQVQGLIDLISDPRLLAIYLQDYNDLFNDNADMFGRIDGNLATEIKDMIKKVNIIVNKINTFIINTNISLPPLAHHILKEYSEITKKSAISLYDLLLPLTPHASTLTKYIREMFWVLQDNKATVKTLFSKVPKQFINMRTTIDNIINLKNIDFLSIFNITNDLIVYEEQTELAINQNEKSTVLNDRILSFQDIVPLQYYRNSLINITIQEQNGELPIKKAFKDILDYDATDLINIGKGIDLIVHSPEYSLGNIIDHITETNISNALIPFSKIFIEIAETKVFKIENINNIGTLIAYEANGLESPSKDDNDNSDSDANVTFTRDNDHGNKEDDNIDESKAGKRKGSIPSGGIIGIMIGCIVVIGVIVGIIIYLRNRPRNDSPDSNDSNNEDNTATETLTGSDDVTNTQIEDL